jgi:hypothetical protein
MVEFLTKPCHLGEVEQALDKAMRRIAPPEPPIIPDPSFAEGGDTIRTTDDDGSRGPGRGVSGSTSCSTLTATAATAPHRRRAGHQPPTLYYKLTEYQKQGFESIRRAWVQARRARSFPLRLFDPVQVRLGPQDQGVLADRRRRHEPAVELAFADDLEFPPRRDRGRFAPLR